MSLDIYQSAWSNLYNTHPTATTNPTFICRFRAQTISRPWRGLHNTIPPPPSKEAIRYAKGEITLHLRGHTVKSVLHSKILIACWPWQTVVCWYQIQWPIYFVSGYVIVNMIHATKHCKRVDYTLITNLMHWLLFIHKILFSSTCFEHQVLIFRRT